MDIVAIAVGILIFLPTEAMASQLTRDLGASIPPGLILDNMTSTSLQARHAETVKIPAPGTSRIKHPGEDCLRQSPRNPR